MSLLTKEDIALERIRIVKQAIEGLAQLKKEVDKDTETMKKKLDKLKKEY